MGRYFREAKRCLEKIKYFYDNAGSTGYSQAQYYHSELARFVGKALASKKEKGDAPLIHGFLIESNKFMDEMKELRDKEKKE